MSTRKELFFKAGHWLGPVLYNPISVSNWKKGIFNPLAWPWTWTQEPEPWTRRTGTACPPVSHPTGQPRSASCSCGRFPGARRTPVVEPSSHSGCPCHTLYKDTPPHRLFSSVPFSLTTPLHNAELLSVPLPQRLHLGILHHNLLDDDDDDDGAEDDEDDGLFNTWSSSNDLLR